MSTAPRYDFSLWQESDSYYFKEGSHYRLSERLGAHALLVDGVEGVYFALWAPHAQAVSVVGDFNHYRFEDHPMKRREDGTGVWEVFIPQAAVGQSYKYALIDAEGHRVEKSDPVATYWEVPPRSASRVYKSEYRWADEGWMKRRGSKNALGAPMSIYELHLGSWRFNADEHRPLTYRELAEQLPDYLHEMGFTHVELLPPTEHPYDGSWGYQCIGYFAPTARFGTPDDFRYLVDRLHQADIGVIIDWVPSHFAVDPHGLARFDGTNLYEHTDPRQGFHPEWGSAIFNLGRHEVKAFLISSALYWLEQFHIDGIRVDAVASMLYLDYARQEGEWIANPHGGRENLEAVEFLQTLNAVAYGRFDDVVMIAEESTAWPMVTRPTDTGGLGFGLKWNMGWMHDTLKYLARDPLYRAYHHDQITFSIWYAFDENFLLSLSHDEVVHMKGSLMGKMPGDEWQRFANLRLLFGYMFAHPGKKLLFMGMEFGQYAEWNYQQSLDWHLLQYPLHRQLSACMADLNRLYRQEPPLYARDFDRDGFEWVVDSDAQNSVLAFWRSGEHQRLLVVCNFTPQVVGGYRIGVAQAGFYQELFNSDAAHYGGSNQGNFGGVESQGVPAHGCADSIEITLPPLAVLIFKPE